MVRDICLMPPPPTNTDMIILQGGCNHMSCKSCDHQFCWVCGQKWAGSHYSCTVKAAQPNSNVRSARLQKYLDEAVRISFLQWHNYENKALKEFKRYRARMGLKVTRYIHNNKKGDTLQGAQILRQAVECVYVVSSFPPPLLPSTS